MRDDSTSRHKIMSGYGDDGDAQATAAHPQGYDELFQFFGACGYPPSDAHAQALAELHKRMQVEHARRFDHGLIPGEARSLARDMLVAAAPAIVRDRDLGLGRAEQSIGELLGALFNDCVDTLLRHRVDPQPRIDNGQVEAVSNREAEQL